MDTSDDLVLMRKGKMMRVQHGEMKPMEMVVNLANGARVLMDGTIVMPDGTSRRLMDGEAVTMDGEMTTAEDLIDSEDTL